MRARGRREALPSQQRVGPRKARFETLGDDAAAPDRFDLGQLLHVLRIRAVDFGIAVGRLHSLERGLGPLHPSFDHIAAIAVAAAERAIAAPGFEVAKLLLHLRLAGAEVDETGIEADHLFGGFLLRGLELSDPLFQVELARQRRFGQILASLAEREARLLVEIGDPVADRLLELLRLDSALLRASMLRPNVVDGAVDLADRFSHHAPGTGPLHRVDRFFRACTQHPPDSEKYRFRHFSPFQRFAGTVAEQRLRAG